MKSIFNYYFYCGNMVVPHFSFVIEQLSIFPYKVSGNFTRRMNLMKMHVFFDLFIYKSNELSVVLFYFVDEFSHERINIRAMILAIAQSTDTVINIYESFTDNGKN